MGCFSCFDSPADEQLNPKLGGAGGYGGASSAPKDANGNVISAQTFTFRELATATRNFRPECMLGKGGFGRVYRGHLESTGQVTLSSPNANLLFSCYLLRKNRASSKLHCCRIGTVCLIHRFHIQSMCEIVAVQWRADLLNSYLLTVD
jgi:hypothetical protein